MQKFLRRKDVEAATGLTCSTIYFLMDKGQFPRPINISDSRVGWLESEIAAWQKEKIDKRDGAPEAA